MTLIFNTVHAAVKVYLRAKYHQAKCTGSSVIVLKNFSALHRNIKNPKIWYCDLRLWPMTLKFCGFQAVLQVHVPAKFHQPAWNSSWFIVLRVRKKLGRKQYSLSLAWVITWHTCRAERIAVLSCSCAHIHAQCPDEGRPTSGLSWSASGRAGENWPDYT